MKRIMVILAMLAATFTVGAREANALGSCTLLPGSNFTTTVCKSSNGYSFQYAQQTCVLNYYTYVVQRGKTVGQNGYSAAGPCTAIIVNRKRVDTNSAINIKTELMTMADVKGNSASPNPDQNGGWIPSNKRYPIQPRVKVG